MSDIGKKIFRQIDINPVKVISVLHFVSIAIRIIVQFYECDLCSFIVLAIAFVMRCIFLSTNQ